ncbi:CDP-alcohol phosphatidyltransferase family protein [Pseudolysinimonas kribbensis]|uniref:CDP-diacylglycerol--glycerol-3-phosphate 3-phosphatidyltransferase n=1 Tax=Pseudolysinimonas kribbensis TaxID=433641 RepID=A0ABQ6K230_9MICO|nr:CDP-alcohol phosphatidyltransferase family protein [Pseudolysinimonas kribbensis]GMA93409.1 CDP-diacylglycerol--glycerol-3-phosphate 3-phosphatidyltransferase [Pseudolysinimonas kribbensis]
MPAVSSRILTVPNVLSLLRLLLIPVFLVLLITQQYLWALVTLVVSSITDFVDGYVARRFDQVSRLGQLLDPAADRLFIFSTLVGLAIRGFLPWWLVGVVVARDVLLLVLGVILAQHRYGPLPVHHLGKLGTFALLVAMPVLVLGAAFPAVDAWAEPVGWAAALWGVFLYWWAGVVYAIQTGRMIRISEDAPAGASDSVDR